ncbi:MAG TPA: VOC family protein, partial [Acetobacteraceae bacterium]|nr:VOC family protein [Acetobacteraceae bacterium]
MANGALGLEHPLVCSRDLDALAARYRALGFAPTPKGVHPWGTGTQLVMFPDNFIELMGIEDRSRIDTASADGFCFGRFIADFLVRREGIAMVALHSKDAPTDLAAVRARGVPSAGMVDFRRAVKLPDGRADEAVVTLAMLIDRAEPQLSHFICHQHRPEFVWVPAWLEHPNGVAGITRITYATSDPLAIR